MCPGPAANGDGGGARWSSGTLRQNDIIGFLWYIVLSMVSYSISKSYLWYHSYDIIVMISSGNLPHADGKDKSGYVWISQDSSDSSDEFQAPQIGYPCRYLKLSWHIPSYPNFIYLSVKFSFWQWSYPNRISEHIQFSILYQTYPQKSDFMLRRNPSYFPNRYLKDFSDLIHQEMPQRYPEKIFLLNSDICVGYLKCILRCI